MDRAELERVERKARAMGERDRVDGQKRIEAQAGGLNPREYFAEPGLVVRRGELQVLLIATMRTHERRRHGFFLSPARLLEFERSPVRRLVGWAWLRVGLLAGYLHQDEEEQ